MRIDDLIYDLRDGTKLLALLEVLSGEKLVSYLFFLNYILVFIFSKLTLAIAYSVR